MEEMTETLSEKMKRFESENITKLKPKTPVIIRLDGRAFYTFTKGLTKPFDEDLSYLMQCTALGLASEIQNTKFIYSQSDEISMLLTDWDNPNTDTWYGYRLQKLISVSASMATVKFNQALMKIIDKYANKMSKLDVILNTDRPYIVDNIPLNKDELKWAIWYKKQFQAVFDSRAFNIPKEEVSNYFLYRYRDAKRNSIQALARSCFSHKQLEYKNISDMIQMVKEKTDIDYNKLPSLQKVGFAVYKNEEENWIIDTEVPDIYENRDYIEKWLM